VGVRISGHFVAGVCNPPRLAIKMTPFQIIDHHYLLTIVEHSSISTYVFKCIPGRKSSRLLPIVSSPQSIPDYLSFFQMAAAIPQDSLVLVTGVNSYIANHVADQLMEAGYRVRGTT
jgi:hypothetical protein